MNRTLYHYSVSPFSRKIRIILSEKGLEFKLVSEKYWERRREFIAMNPAAQVPVLVDIVDSEDITIVDSGAIVEYLEEKYTNKILLGKSIIQKAETRRIANWFNNKFYYEVTKHVIDERVIKYYKNAGEPNSNALQAARSNINYHLDYIAFLLRTRDWLAGERFSLADITAASHLSVLDYLSEVPWEKHEEVKDWYSLIKSRPSFRSLLNDKFSGFEPSAHYTNLDF